MVAGASGWSHRRVYRKHRRRRNEQPGGDAQAAVEPANPRLPATFHKLRPMPPAPLQHVETLATPYYATLLLADEDADAVDSDLAAASRENVVACDGYQMYIGSQQADIPVRVVVAVWPDDPHRGVEAWDGEVVTTLFCRTGHFLLREMAGGVPGDWQLPATGRYDVRLRWRNREITEQAAHGGTPVLDDAAFHGLEEYCVDMWLSADQEEE